MRKAKTSLVLVVLVSSLACDGETGPTDASADGGADGGSLAAPPEIPWLESGMPFTSLEPCPEGYRLDTEQMPAECDPYPAAGPEACDAGDAHFPGEPGCRPVGAACPDGDFPEDLPTDGPTIYVSASAAPGGDGSMAAPFARLGDVSWASLPSDAIVALGKGRYEGVLSLDAGVRVYGACAAETILTGLDAPLRGVVLMNRAGEAASVANLTISGAPQYGVVVESGSLRLEGLQIEGVVGVAVLAANPDSDISLRDVVIDGTILRGPGDDVGYGIWATLGGRVEGARIIVSRSKIQGVISQHEGSVVSLADTVIRDAVGADDGTWGRGVSAQTSGRFEGTRVLIEDNRDIGLIVSNAGEAVLEDVVIRNTRSNERTGEGRGISVQEGSRLTADRVVISESRDVAVLVADLETVVTLRDVIVRDTLGADGDGRYGRALTVFGGGHLEASNLVVARGRELAIGLDDPGTTGVFADVAVRDIEPRGSDGEFGRGLDMSRGASLEASRVLIERTRELAILAAEDATASVQDVVIRNAASLGEEPVGGVGMAAQGRSRISGSRIAINDVRVHGIASIFDGDIELEDVRIERVFESPSPDAPFGHGATVVDSRLRLTRFEIVSPDFCGVFLAQSAGEEVEVDLVLGRVEGAQIGACVQAPGYDLMRLTDSVQYVDNGVNLDATSLPVPMAVGEIEGL